MKVHDKYVIEIEEIIRGYGNNPEVEDPLGVCSPLARIKGFRTLIFDQDGLDKLTPYDPDEAYQRGLNDAWDLADDVSHNRGNILDILGCPTFGVVFEQLTASEAIQKLKEYERKKKAEEEFQVGDEVESEDGETAYVLNPDYDGTLILSMEKYTCPQRQSKTEWKKTGFRNEKIAELLGLEDAR